MNYVALSFLTIFSLPFLFLLGQVIYRWFFAMPPLPSGIRLIRMGNKWGFRDGMYLSQLTFRTRRAAALHAIGYRRQLSRL